MENSIFDVLSLLESLNFDEINDAQDCPVRLEIQVVEDLNSNI